MPLRVFQDGTLHALPPPGTQGSVDPCLRAVWCMSCHWQLVGGKVDCVGQVDRKKSTAASLTITPQELLKLPRKYFTSGNIRCEFARLEPQRAQSARVVLVLSTGLRPIPPPCLSCGSDAS